MDNRKLEKNYYEILGVATDASEQEIKIAYKKLVLQLHPDKNPNDAAAAQAFQKVAAAHATLSDKDKRFLYDKLLKYGNPEILQNVAPKNTEAKVIFGPLPHDPKKFQATLRKIIMDYKNASFLNDQAVLFRNYEFLYQVIQELWSLDRSSPMLRDKQISKDINEFEVLYDCYKNEILSSTKIEAMRLQDYLIWQLKQEIDNYDAKGDPSIVEYLKMNPNFYPYQNEFQLTINASMSYEPHARVLEDLFEKVIEKSPLIHYLKIDHSPMGSFYITIDPQYFSMVAEQRANKSVSIEVDLVEKAFENNTEAQRIAQYKHRLFRYIEERKHESGSEQGLVRKVKDIVSPTAQQKIDVAGQLIDALSGRDTYFPTARDKKAVAKLEKGRLGEIAKEPLAMLKAKRHYK